MRGAWCPDRLSEAGSPPGSLSANSCGNGKPTREPIRMVPDCYTGDATRRNAVSAEAARSLLRCREAATTIFDRVALLGLATLAPKLFDGIGAMALLSPSSNRFTPPWAAIRRLSWQR
jgi:hypothetical protein